MNQEIADPKDVAACLEKVRATLGQLGELQDNLKQRAATLAASAEDITGRLRSVGIDTPEAIEKIYESLSDDVKASARPVTLEPAAPDSGRAIKPRKMGRMV
ncbi:hypothetical protein [Hydrogenophaga sp.]|uniref:hypothetical protein n=1 Tax=Hydrogenophaga sp. TaxID=1904254 RepID=UPI002727C849|nr:hypothetical protein [Hydrogenophaga sp.]MDO9438903.1 hypothetical protein [Hydrogenophaga sp.]